MEALKNLEPRDAGAEPVDVEIGFAASTDTIHAARTTSWTRFSSHWTRIGISPASK